MKRLLLTTLAVGLLAACLPEEPTANATGSNQSTDLNLAQFLAWPAGEVETADPEAFGRDNLIFVVDRSGSMDWDACGGGGTKSEVARKALATFIPQIPDDIAVGWIDFGNRSDVVVPLGLNNRSQLVDAAQDHRGDMGGTYVGHATGLAFDLMAEQALAQSSTGTYRIVLIVDGAADDGSTLISELNDINQTPVEVLTAGYCVGSNHVLNQPTDNVYVEASNAEDLVNVLTSTIQAESANFATGGFTAATPVTE